MASRRFGEERRKIGSVKAAINMYGGSSLRSSSASNKLQNDSPESSSVAKQLHKYKREISLYQETRKAAESEKAKAESELSTAKKTVKKLSLLIEESNSKVKAQKRRIERLKVEKEKVVMTRNTDHSEFADLSRELEFVKQELNNLKLDIASVLEDKFRAKNTIEESGLKMELGLRSIESLEKETEIVNEEHVLVELARIEALKEFREIEADREKMTGEFLVALDERHRKIKEMMEEIEKTKEMEDKLTTTLSDVDMLETQLKLVKEMERRDQGDDGMRRLKNNFERDDNNLPLLKEITEELEAKKMELSSIEAEGFQVVTLINGVSNELTPIKEETARLNKFGGKTDLKIQLLNSKLLRAKSKLEAVTASEEQAKVIATNLSATFDKLKIDTEAAKKEKLFVEEETDAVRAETRKTEIEIDEKEGILLSKLRELEEVKYSEALALEKLESYIETAIEARASASEHCSTITITRFEYEYLTGCAIQAQEVADKKVAAAEAWTEALKASEREVLMRTEMLKTRVEDETEEVCSTQMPISSKKLVGKEIQKWKQNRLKSMEIDDVSSRPRRRSSIKNGNGKPGQTPRIKYRKESFSSATRATPTYFVVKKRRKVLNLVKFLTGKR